MNKKIILAVVIITLLIGCTAPQQTTEPAVKKGVSAGGDEATVRIKGMKFVPNNINIKTGTTVTWRNEDPVPHNVISNDGTLQSPLLHQGDVWSFTFDKQGTYSYVCSLHSGMKGNVVVE
ncbi:cupredoxin domain-containing protein [Candidatus Woesearchaeota archaeon]|nr:cupredoxin domain-containing protein [Candidatus Woesearchaeota archaeon]